MKKYSVSIIVTVFSISALLSCAGYFPGHHGPGNPHNNNQKGLQAAERIGQAMEGGGYLSSDTANDITPFIFRDKTTGSAFIFFASDRDGAYAIYYAGMDAQGEFFNLTKMGSDINLGSMNISPAVFQLNGSNFISYISITGGNSTNVITAGLNGAFQTNGSFINFMSISPQNPTHISVYSDPSGNIYMLAANGSASIQIFSITMYGWNLYSTITVNSPQNSIGGYLLTSGGFANVFLLYDSVNSGIHQLGGELWSQNAKAGTNFLNAFNISDYTSSANDAYPFVDTGDSYKVYFASDRYGKGNYDLYRYNTTTYDREVPSYFKNGLNAMYVAPASQGGSDKNSGVSPLSPFQTIQTAIDDAFTWGITNVFLQAGTYTPGSGLVAAATSSEGFWITNVSNISITGGFDSAFSSAGSMSVLDAQGGWFTYTTIYMTNSFNISLNNLALINNNLYAGQGIYCGYCSNIIFSNLIVTNNGTNGTLYGYVYGGGFSFNYSTNISIIGSSISYDQAYSGGGLYAWYLPGIGIMNSTISHNLANQIAGGLEFLGSGADFIISNCIIDYNSAGIDGGGIIIDYYINNFSIIDISTNGNIPNDITSNTNLTG